MDAPIMDLRLDRKMEVLGGWNFLDSGLGFFMPWNLEFGFKWKKYVKCMENLVRACFIVQFFCAESAFKFP